MSSKIKKLTGLKRKLEVKIDTDEYNSSYSAKLKKIRSTVKLDGFRKGSAPDNVLIQKYGPSIHYEILNELIQKTYPIEIKAQSVNPASAPKIEIKSEDPKKGISYNAEFEVFPEIKPKLGMFKKYEETTISFNDKDVDFAIDDILDRYGEWKEVKRNVKEHDQATIDFVGTIDGEEFEGSSSKNFPLVIGSNSMIPGFEEAIIGKKIGDEFSINVTFPEDYFKKDLAGKATKFETKLLKVEEKIKAKVDSALFSSLMMDEVKTPKEFRAEIVKRMEKEVEQQEKSLTKESIYKLILDVNKFDIPQATLDDQMKSMRNDALARMGQKLDDAPEDLYSEETFREDAEKRIKLDLLFSAFLKKYELEVSESEIQEYLEKESKKYKEPEQYMNWAKTQQNTLENFKMIILEDKLIEKLKSELKSSDKVIKFKDLSSLQK